jgi:hypothetical protein
MRLPLSLSWAPTIEHTKRMATIKMSMAPDKRFWMLCVVIMILYTVFLLLDYL